MKKKTKIYLVGNAHLDPVWQWRWQEGSAEAKATIRSALDRMKEFPEFRFVCSSASVYQWVQEFAPEMFEELKERVAEGRFIVVGGWHVQPDCNMPSGEAFARQSLYAQRYFKETLGVTAKVGYDVDSFGHNAMLPQILRKSGMDSYIFMRPAPHEKKLDSDVFNWVSADGSSVMTYRILDPYCFNFEDETALEERMSYLNENSATDLDELPFFYGVGNHGGGPTIRNLEVLREYKEKHPETELHYSDISDFFDDVITSGAKIPEFRDDLQHHASGCYSTVSHVKNGIRRSETGLVAAESFSTLAKFLCGRNVPGKELEKAWKNICFLHFHDSMDGCCIKEAHDDAMYQYGAALNTAAVVENNALQTISWAIDTGDQSKGLPVVVFNPHGFAAETTVQVNMEASGVTDSDGNILPSQLVHASCNECYWRHDTLFRATIPALGYSVFYLRDPKRSFGTGTSGLPQEGPVRAVPYEGARTANAHGTVALENEFFHVEFDLHNGYIVSFIDRETGAEMLCGQGAVPVVIDEYYHDTWSHGKNFFTDEMARFADAEVTVLESGPVRATVKVVSRYNDSTLTQYFSLETGCSRLKVRAVADWHEKHKMLKLAWPMAVNDPKAYYEIPFGVIERPADGEEEPGLTWTAVKGTDGGFALINSNTYSSSVKGSTLYQTVLRSPIYGDHGGPRDAESEFTDQGRFDFAYELMPVGESFAPVIRAARLLNKPVTNIIETWHSGTLSSPSLEGLHISEDNIGLSACKPSEDGTGLILRLYETDGRETDVIVSGAILRIPLKARFTPYSVNTYLLKDGEDVWQEVLLTEYPIEG